MIERGLMEIYRFLPPSLLEKFDPEQLHDINEFLNYVAMARVAQEMEVDIVRQAIVRAFSEK